MLTPIGYDIPQPPPSRLLAPAQLPNLDTTGLQIVAGAQDNITNSLRAQQNAVQSMAEAGLQTAKLAESNAAQVAAASTAAARADATAASVAADTWRQTLATIGNFAETQARLKELDARRQEKLAAEVAAAQEKADRERMAAIKALAAQRAEQQKKNVVELLPKLEEFRDSFIMGDGFKRAGPKAYRDDLAKLVAEYDLDPEDQARLLRDYSKPAEEYSRANFQATEKYAADIKQAEYNQKLAGLKISLSGSLGALRAATGQSDREVSAAFARVQDQIAEFYKKGGDPLETAQLVAEALDISSKELSEVNSATAEIRRQAALHAKYAAFLAQKRADVAAGKLPASSYEALARQEAANLGVPYYLPDPLTDEAYAVRAKEQANTVVELQQREAISAAEQIEATTATIGSIATSMALSPAAQAAFRAQQLKDPNVKQAIRIFDEYQEFQKNEVPKIRQEQADTAVSLELQKQSFNRWLINAQNGQNTPDVLEMLRNQGLGLPDITPGKAITQEQLNVVYNDFQALQKARVAQLQAKLDAYRQRQLYFAKYGLFEDPADVKKANAAFKLAGEAYKKRLEQVRQATISLPGNQPGQNPNFNAGVPGKPPVTVPLARTTYAGVAVTLPFGVADSKQLAPFFAAQGFGASRPAKHGGTRAHQGLDFAVPVNTPMLSLATGSITEIGNDPGGYGNYVVIRGDDKREYLYAHLNKVLAVKGQRVAIGQKFALSGNTGAGSGPHLHLEITENGKHLNPLTALAENRYGPKPAQPRTSTPIRPASFFPHQGVPLGGNKWLHNGKVYSVAPDPRVPTATTPATVKLSSPTAMPPTVPTANHGYAKLAKNVSLAKAINKAAKEIGVPGVWLADVISLESAGTFSPSVGNGRGFFGLIQFGESARRDLGVTTEQLTSMSAEKQLGLVVRYLRMQKQYAGIKNFKSIYELAGAINLGHTMLKDIRERGIRAILDPKNRDTARPFSDYVQKLGEYAGRKYDLNPVEHLRASIHTSPEHNCKICSQLSIAGDFIIHRSVS